MVVPGISFAANALFDCFLKPVADRFSLLQNLSSNTDKLTIESTALEELKRDVEVRLCNLVTDQRREKSNQAIGWLESVETLLKSKEDFKNKYDRRRANCNCLACGWYKNYKLAKKAVRLLERAQQLKEQGNNFTDDQLVARIPTAPVAKIHIHFEVVGLEGELAEALRFVDDDDGRVKSTIVGIWGMGGSGKSTLLKMINNHFHDKNNSTGSGFDVVIYATAGRDSSIAEMQKEVGKRLGLSLSETGDKEEQKSQILSSLQSKSFLLLLDDLWDSIDLERLGVPPINSDSPKKRKVVIATRDVSICHDMRIEEKHLVQMGLLNPEQSWKLFCKVVGNMQVLEDTRIQPFARDVASQCGGLPLTLVTVGTAMESVTDVSQWSTAKSELRDSPHEIRGMEEKVLSLLKFSFDRLKKDTMREILLLCLVVIGNARSYQIRNLAIYIVAEGLLDVQYGLARARDKATTLIRTLANASLLMYCGKKKSKVRLHESVQDMLIWLMNSKHQETVKWFPSFFSSSENPGSQISVFFRKWKHARRIAMDSCSLEKIPDDREIPRCNDLCNLLWRSVKIVRLPENFFGSMPSLAILDMQGSRIEVLPKSIGTLSRLKILHLCRTAIGELPVEIGDLQLLTTLCLYGTSKLSDIPRESISRLHHLDTLDVTFSSFQWAWDYREDYEQVAFQDLHELAENGKLSSIKLSFVNYDGAIIHSLAGSPKLLRSITELVLDNCNKGENMINMQPEIIAKMEGLKRLCLKNLDLSAWQLGSSFSLPGMLSFLSIENCSGMTRLELTARAASLQELHVISCGDLITLLPSEGRKDLESEATPFPYLKKLKMAHCQKLHSIQGIFSSMGKLIIEDCPELKKLHLDEQSAARIRKIKGSEEWWNSLDWESDEAMSRLLNCYSPLAK